MKKAHISIDDCITALRELSEHSNIYASIFDLDFFQCLSRLHRRYGVVFSLYLWEQKSGFRISQMTEKYKEEFEACSEWMKFGFHGSAKFDYLNTRNGGRTPSEFKEVYMHAVNDIKRCFSNCAMTDTIRLHRYTACKEEITFLMEQGIHTVLTAHDNRISYDLTKEENDRLRKNGKLTVNGMQYICSDFCIELIDDVPCTARFDKDHDLVLFTHEKYLFQELDKVDTILQWTIENNYEFVNENFK